MLVLPEDKAPLLLHDPPSRSLDCFRSVNLRIVQVVHHICAVFNAQIFRRFLKQLLRYRRGRCRMIVVLDKARYRHTVLLKPFLREYAKQLQLLFLPP